MTTLDGRQLAAGLAEVVKIALVADDRLLEQIERDSAALARGSADALIGIVRAAVEAKIRIVRDDEHERGSRALLNLGHTIGHAIEAQGGYRRWLHGEAVALGTVAELRATAAMGLSPALLVERTERLLSALGLPTRLDAPELAAAWPFVASDKKRGQGALRLPVVVGPGKGVVQRVTVHDLRSALLPSG